MKAISKIVVTDTITVFATYRLQQCKIFYSDGTYLKTQLLIKTPKHLLQPTSLVNHVKCVPPGHFTPMKDLYNIAHAKSNEIRQNALTQED